MQLKERKMSTTKHALQIMACCSKGKYGQTPRLSSSIYFPFKQLARELKVTLLDVPHMIKKNAVKLVDAFVDSAFEFVDQPCLPSESNFAPVEELGEAIMIENIEGSIPHDFPQGVYIRNGPNPTFGGLKSTISVLGKSSRSWIEGEGMLHALYLKKSEGGKWNISYNRKYVHSDTFISERERNKPAFLPAIEGDPPAVLSAYLLNWLRFGAVDKYYSNTNIIEHAGRYYATAENHAPQEIDITTLETLGKWHLDANWKRPFTSHPKKILSTGELVTFGITGLKPYCELGILSADGEKILHKVDVKLNRCTLSHDIGVTERYNIILDFPLTINVLRLVKGGTLFKYEDQTYARIGVMPRYGDSNSIKWFEVETCCVFHIFNCYEDEDEVVVVACKARDSLITGPDFGINKSEWFSRGYKNPESVEETGQSSEDGQLFTWAHEWRLNIQSGEVKTRNLTGTDFFLECPFINERFTGLRNKFGYAQVGDCIESSISGKPKFGGLAKLHFEETRPTLDKDIQAKELIKVEYHEFPIRTFCSGAAFVPRPGGVEEDDGWIITFAHNEDNDVSQVFIIDAKKLASPPVARITLPLRVPYGFHGTFFQTCDGER